MTDIIKLPKVTIMLDASKLDLFETCPRRYQLRHIRRKVLPLINKSEALDKGGLAHQGFEVYFQALAEGKHYDDRMRLSLIRMNTTAADPDQSSLEPEEASALIRAFEESCDYWRSEDENCIEVLAVEAPFAYVLFEDDEIRIIISGKIDLLCNFRSIGGHSNYEKLPMDHKTYSRDGPVLRKTNQFINYCNAVGSDILVVNRVGLHDPEAKKPKPAEEKFKRIPLSYDKQYIQDWKDNLTKLILHEYLTCLGTDYWPEKPTSCNKFNRLCEYYRICDMSGEDAKEFKIQADYIDGEEWDVTKGLEGD